MNEPTLRAHRRAVSRDTAQRRLVRRLLACTALVVSSIAHAEPVQGVRSLDTEPIAVRGGVLMVPLAARRGGDHWPQTIELSLADGRRIAGVVALVHALPPPIHRHWTDDPRGLAVRSIQPTDDTSAPGTGAAYLLARLPRAADGPLRLAEQTLRPRWQNPPHPIESNVAESQRPATLALVEQLDRPDPKSPFEYWRWTLLAERLDMNAPAPDGYGTIGSLVAEHYADLWRLGMARLEAVSPGVAAQCRNLLTRTCMDRLQPFAAWVANPDEIGTLLALLLNFNRADREVMHAALAWADAKDRLLIWPEEDTRDRVTTAIANPTYEPIVAKFRWLFPDEIPVAEELEPGALTRVQLERPASSPTGDGAAQDGTDAAQLVLLVEAAGHQQRVVFGRGSLPAKPPGVFFAPLRPPLTLAELQTRRHRPLAADRATMVHIRKLNRRWEVFFECRRPAAPNPAPAGQGDLEACTGVQDTRGIEAVTVLLGSDRPDGPPAVTLTVPEYGWHRLFQGHSDESLQVHRRSFSDRWHCRIVLPDSWLRSAAGGGGMVVGLVRTHADSDAAETAPYASVPWRMNPGRTAINLTTWDDPPTR